MWNLLRRNTSLLDEKRKVENIITFRDDSVQNDTIERMMKARHNCSVRYIETWYSNKNAVDCNVNLESKQICQYRIKFNENDDQCGTHLGKFQRTNGYYKRRRYCFIKLFILLISLLGWLSTRREEISL